MKTNRAVTVFSPFDNIPSTWTLTPLAYLFKIVGGNGFPPELQGESCGDLPFFKNSDINAGADTVSTARNYVSHWTAIKEGFNVIPPRSILMGKIGESMKKNHRVLNTTQCCIDNNMQAMVPVKEKTDPLYALHALKVLDASHFDNGGPVPSIDNTKWRKVKLPLPPLAEQKRIAREVGLWSSQIGMSLQLLSKQVAALQQFRQSFIHKTVTKGLEPTAPMKPSGIDWIGVIPEHWSVRRLKDILQIHNGKDPTGDSGEVPVYGSGGEFKKTDTPLCNSRSILYGRKGTIDKPLLVPGGFWTVDTMYYTTPRLPLSLEFVYYASSIFDFEQIRSGSTLPSVTQSDLGSIKLPWPPQAEQFKISEFLNNRLKSLDAAVQAKKRQLDLLREQRQSLVFEYVSGKRRVGEE